MFTLSTDFMQLLKENQTGTNKVQMTCYTGVEVIKGKFILRGLAGTTSFPVQ